MLAEIIVKALNSSVLDRLERTHPIISLAIWQITSAVLVVASVTGIAFVGGSLIWVIGKLAGTI